MSKHCCTRIIPIAIISAAVGFMLGLFISSDRFTTIYSMKKSQLTPRRNYYGRNITNSINFASNKISEYNTVRRDNPVIHGVPSQKNDRLVRPVIDRPSAQKKNIRIAMNRKSTESSSDISSICTMAECAGNVLSRDITEVTSWSVNRKVCSVSDSVIKTFFRTTLRGPEQTPIFVYKPENDVWVSRSIINAGIWEGDLVTKIHTILKKDKDLVFLDIGANVGVFCLSAAKLGSRVIAIDALASNIQRLCQSVEAGDLSRHIVLIHNALSNTRERVALGVHRSNVGGTYVKKLSTGVADQYSVNSILLDDLLEIFPKLSKVVIKMDVETFEAKVLEGGRRFFKEVKVMYLMMEFVAHKNQPSGAFIAKFLKEHGLEPQIHSSILNDYSKWPGDILFKRVGA